MEIDKEGSSYVSCSRSLIPPAGTRMLCSHAPNPGLYSPTTCGFASPKRRSLQSGWVQSTMLRRSTERTGRYAVNLSPGTAPGQVRCWSSRRRQQERKPSQAIEHRVATVEACHGTRGPRLLQRPGLFQAASAFGFEPWNIKGRLASSMSRSLGVPVGRITDPRFGLVNTYHIEVLDEVASGLN